MPNDVQLVPMTKETHYHEVHPDTVEAHKAAGYELTAKRDIAAEEKLAADPPSKGKNVEELKAVLTEMGIAIPEGGTKKDLAALLDAAVAL